MSGGRIGNTMPANRTDPELLKAAAIVQEAVLDQIEARGMMIVPASDVIAPNELRALAVIEWWMGIHRDRRHLGGTLTLALETLSPMLRRLGQPADTTSGDGVYAQSLAEVSS